MIYEIGGIVPSFQHPAVLGAAAAVVGGAVYFDRRANKEEMALEAPVFPDPEQQQLVGDLVRKNRLIKRIGYYAAVGAASFALVQAAHPTIEGPSRPGELSFVLNADETSYTGHLQDGNLPIVDEVNGSLKSALGTNDAACVFVLRGGSKPVGCLPKVKGHAAVVHMENNLGMLLNPYADTASGNSSSPMADSVQSAIMNSNVQDSIVIETDQPLSPTDAASLKASASAGGAKNNNNFRVSAIVVNDGPNTTEVEASYASVIGHNNVSVASSASQIKQKASLLADKNKVNGPSKPLELPRDAALLCVTGLGLEAIRRRMSGHVKSKSLQKIMDWSTGRIGSVVRILGKKTSMEEA